MTLYLIGNLLVLLTCLLFLSTTISLFKGAPFVPTPMKTVRRMLEIADIQPGQTIIDLGSGDGRFLSHAEQKYQAKAIGYEISPAPYIYSIIYRLLNKLSYKVYFKSFRKAKIQHADLVICYLFPERMKEFQEWFLKNLKPETKIISYVFRIPDWTPIKQENKIFLYQIPK